MENDTENTAPATPEENAPEETPEVSPVAKAVIATENSRTEELEATIKALQEQLAAKIAEEEGLDPKQPQDLKAYKPGNLVLFIGRNSVDWEPGRVIERTSWGVSVAHRGGEENIAHPERIKFQ